MIKFLAVIFAACAVASFGQPATTPSPFCNPLNLNYHLWGGYREAADPTGMIYNNDYYIFASKSRGYWWSPDMCSWTFVKHTAQTLPDIDGYAPTVWEYNGYIYVTTNDVAGIYRTNNPKSGAAWEKVSNGSLPWDMSVFKGFDGNYYCTGAHDRICRLNPDAGFILNESYQSWNNCASYANHGWELNPSSPNGGDNWYEGGWVLPYNGKYYFHYAAPATTVDEYADRCQVGTNPLGPYQYLENSPVASKPSGFITGGGHGSVFIDKSNQCWRLSTMVISVRAGFERRIALFPTSFDPEGAIYHDQVMGDYPRLSPIPSRQAPCGSGKQPDRMDAAVVQETGDRLIVAQQPAGGERL